jgi:hypothetical protein
VWVQEKVQQRFPVLYRNMGKHNTRMVWASPVAMCGNGWFDLIWRLSEDLEKLKLALFTSQVKEKFGILRFRLKQSDYADKVLDPAKLIKDERVLSRIREAEDESAKIHDNGY